MAPGHGGRVEPVVQTPVQADDGVVLHHRLARGAGTDIITWLDDHSRYALPVSARPRVTASIVVATFRTTAAQHGYRHRR